MRWYGLNINKFCGIVISSVNPDTPDVPVVTDTIFIARMPVNRKEYKVINNVVSTDKFIINVESTKQFKVIGKTAEVVKYKAVFNKADRKFRVIQN